MWSDTAWYIITAASFVVLVTFAGYAFIQQQKQFLLTEKQKEIATIADLKTLQLVKWRKERIAEAASIRANAMMTHRIQSYLSGSEKAEVKRELRHWMANLVDLGEYSKALLYTPNGGIISSDSEPQRPPPAHYSAMITETAVEQELFFSDFHTDDSSAPYDIELAIPILYSNGSRSRCIAVLLLEIDPSKRLYPLIQSWPTTSSTAETLLVRREGDSVLFLNTPRYRNIIDGPIVLPLSKSDMPAVRAVLGQEGGFRGVDYRNVEVLSENRIIPGTQWGLVTKIDVSEALSPLKRSILIVISAGIVVIITMILGLFLWGQRRKSESLRKLFEIQKKAESRLIDLHAKLEQQIVERTSDLTEINTLLRSEMDERKQLEHQLLSAKRLEAIGQIAGGVAHEVRNPLNAILTITEALFRENEIASNPEFEPFIQHIRTQVNRLALLMNDLLDLGRNIPEINLQPLPLYQICCETVDLWKSTGMSKNKHAVLTADCDTVSTRVLADSLKLQQVLFNLLENAGHHTPDNSSIDIRLTHNLPDAGTTVQVIDRGTGIPEDKLTYVFDPFYTGRKGGTGLGLALVRHFIENMGGTVRIWNNDPPPGCTVEIRIPLYREELH